MIGKTNRQTNRDYNFIYIITVFVMMKIENKESCDIQTTPLILFRIFLD